MSAGLRSLWICCAFALLCCAVALPAQTIPVPANLSDSGILTRTIPDLTAQLRARRVPAEPAPQNLATLDDRGAEALIRVLSVSPRALQGSLQLAVQRVAGRTAITVPEARRIVRAWQRLQTEPSPTE